MSQRERHTQPHFTQPYLDNFWQNFARVPHFWPILPEVGLSAEANFRFREQDQIFQKRERYDEERRLYPDLMPWSLKRYHDTGGLHFLTWSCHDRLPFLGRSERRDLFLKVLEQMRTRYHFGIVGFVVMPEHIHLLASEPMIGDLSSLICAIKLGLTRRLQSEKPHLWQNRPEVGHPSSPNIWMKRYYDFNVWSQRKEDEKLHYMHNNPVTRGLVARPEDWKWSSFRHYSSGEDCGAKLNDWSSLLNKIHAKAKCG